MPEYLPFLIFGGVVVAVIIAVIISNKRRKEAWQKLSQELGFLYSEQNVAPFPSEVFALFNSGYSRRWNTSIKGEIGDAGIVLADYQYTTGSGKNSTTHRTTLCQIQSESINLPKVYMRPQIRFIDAIGKMFGGQDIDFDDDPAFSKMFVLQGDEEQDIRDFFTQNIRKAFASLGKDKFYLEALGDIMIVYRKKRLNIEETKNLLSDSLDILALIQDEG